MKKIFLVLPCILGFLSFAQAQDVKCDIYGPGNSGSTTVKVHDGTDATFNRGHVGNYEAGEYTVNVARISDGSLRISLNMFYGEDGSQGQIDLTTGRGMTSITKSGRPVVTAFCELVK